MKPFRIPVAVFSLLVASACASSYAEPNRPPYGEWGRPAPSWTDSTPVPYSSPYGVELLSGDFRLLPTFHQGSRTYVMGFTGDRYRVRITNPTPRRVEAVVSVDGLDAIDGRPRASKTSEATSSTLTARSPSRVFERRSTRWRPSASRR